jgi:hypothetical protein
MEIDRGFFEIVMSQETLGGTEYGWPSPEVRSTKSVAAIENWKMALAWECMAR